MRDLVFSDLLKCSSITEVCDSRNRTKLMRYEKTLISRSYVGLVKSVNVKSLTPHWSSKHQPSSPPIPNYRARTYLHHQPPQADKETHEIARFIGNNIRVIPTNIIRCSTHRRVDSLTGDIHQQLRKPFHDHLDLLRIRLDQVG